MMGAFRFSSITAMVATAAFCLAQCGCIAQNYGGFGSENEMPNGGVRPAGYQPMPGMSATAGMNGPAGPGGPTGCSACAARAGLQQVNYVPAEGDPQMKDGLLPGLGVAPMPGGPHGFTNMPQFNPGPLPVETIQVSHPPYTVAPPDILYIDALRMIPRPPYRIEPLEILVVNVTETLPNEPISGQATVSPEGNLSLGGRYGMVKVGGLTLEEAQEAIRRHLISTVLNEKRNPQVTLSLLQVRAMQQVRGQHLIRQDGTIGLGTYGSVYVAGMTLGQIKCVVEKHLSMYVQDPQVSVDVFAYNSKVYYLIFDGAGYGQQVFRLPITGNETVLDAISRVQGLPPVASKRKIWLARPTAPNSSCNQIMVVDWNAITQAGSTATNYQIFPGDRIYVSSNPWILFSNRLSQVLNPIEQLMGATLLGAETVFGVKTAINPTLAPGVVVR